MHMNMYYINMCKLKKNRERRNELGKEREREVGGDGVCGSIWYAQYRNIGKLNTLKV